MSSLQMTTSGLEYAFTEPQGATVTLNFGSAYIMSSARSGTSIHSRMREIASCERFPTRYTEIWTLRLEVDGLLKTAPKPSEDGSGGNLMISGLAMVLSSAKIGLGLLDTISRRSMRKTRNSSCVRM